MLCDVLLSRHELIKVARFYSNSPDWKPGSDEETISLKATVSGPRFSGKVQEWLIPQYKVKSRGEGNLRSNLESVPPGLFKVIFKFSVLKP